MKSGTPISRTNLKQLGFRFEESRYALSPVYILQFDKSTYLFAKFYPDRGWMCGRSEGSGITNQSPVRYIENLRVWVKQFENNPLKGI